jgi:anti-sigma B factor antagonist
LLTDGMGSHHGADETFQINLSTGDELDGAEKNVVVAPVGDLDLATAPALREMLIELVAAGMVRVVVDLADVTFIDSSGLGILVGAAKRLEAANGRLAIRNPRPQAQQVLELTGLDEVLGMEESEAQ